MTGRMKGRMRPLKARLKPKELRKRADRIERRARKFAPVVQQGNDEKGEGE